MVRLGHLGSQVSQGLMVKMESMESLDKTHLTFSLSREMKVAFTALAGPKDLWDIRVNPASAVIVGLKAKEADQVGTVEAVLLESWVPWDPLDRLAKLGQPERRERTPNFLWAVQVPQAPLDQKG